MKRRHLLTGAAAAALPMPALGQGAASRPLRFVPQAGLTALDPIWTTAAVTMNHAYCVFDTLYGLDSSMSPRPQMAEGHTVSDDRLTWTIRLREGLRFHDGEPVRAEDCTASLRRWSARDTFGQTLARSVEAWEAIDDRTFRVRLKSPFPLLVDALAKPAYNVPFIMPRRLAETDPTKQVTEMVGSGPYRFKADEFLAGSQAVYTRFEGYVPRQEAAVWTSGGKKAYFDRIEWKAIPDAATTAAALRTGEVDWWEQVLPDLAASLKSDPRIRLGEGDPTGYFGVLRFNLLQPPFDNPRIRRAIMRAVRQTDYMDATTGGDRSAYRLCQALFPCGTPYGGPPGAPGSEGPVDLAGLRAEIKAAGYAGERIVVLNPSDFPTIQPFGQITHELLTKGLGMNAELAEMDWGTLVQRRTNRGPVAQGGWSIFHTWVNGASAVNPAVNMVVRGLGPAGYFGWYSSPPLEEKVAAWLSAPDEQSRGRLASEVNGIAMNDAPTVPLGQFSIRTAYRSDLSGMVAGPAPFQWGIRRG